MNIKLLNAVNQIHNEDVFCNCIGRQESQYTRSLIEASRDPLFTINPKGKITDINKASITITDVTREKLIGTDFFDYFTEPDKARDIYKQIFAKGFVADFPLTIRDGKLTEVLFNGSVYKDESGKVIGVVVVARDITDHNRIEKKLIEATAYIRNQMKSKIPIIALTADVTTADLQKCTAVGMNDYISKPVDERLLYGKIVDLLKKPVSTPAERSSGVDLTFLKKQTKNNHKLIMEMIEIYLEQTPPLVSIMKQSLKNKDWDSLRSAVHKMIPSFSIVGIHKDFENMARKIQEYSRNLQHLDELPELVTQIDNVCTHACKELEKEYKLIKIK